MKRLLCPLLGLFVTASILHAQTIAQWTFETSGPSISGTAASFTGIVPEVGSGTASGVHANPLAVWSSPAGNGEVESLSVNFWGVGDYFEFQTSTLGYSGIGVSFDQTSSSTGPRDFSLLYSTDGSTFTSFANYTVLQNGLAPNAAWSSASARNPVYTYSFDLSAVTVLDNAPAAYFRLTDMSTSTPTGGTVGTGGTDRVDNFTVGVVPEPTSLSLMGGFCVLAWAFIRRRQ